MKSLDFSRSDRLSDQVRSEISIILRDKVKDPRLSGLTVLKVEITKDIQKAYIYFSSSNSFNNTEREDVLLGLNKAKGFIRVLLGKRINVKRVPELVFEEDKSNLL